VNPAPLPPKKDKLSSSYFGISTRDSVSGIKNRLGKGVPQRVKKYACNSNYKPMTTVKKFVVNSSVTDKSSEFDSPTKLNTHRSHADAAKKHTSMIAFSTPFKSIDAESTSQQEKSRVEEEYFNYSSSKAVQNRSQLMDASYSIEVSTFDGRDKLDHQDDFMFIDSL